MEAVSSSPAAPATPASPARSAQAGFGEDGLGPGEEEALAQLDGFPAPFPELAGFLHRIVAGEVPAVPDGLPVELRQLLEGL